MNLKVVKYLKGPSATSPLIQESLPQQLRHTKKDPVWILSVTRSLLLYETALVTRHFLKLIQNSFPCKHLQMVPTSCSNVMCLILLTFFLHWALNPLILWHIGSTSVVYRFLKTIIPQILFFFFFFFFLAVPTSCRSSWVRNWTYSTVATRAATVTMPDL